MKTKLYTFLLFIIFFNSQKVKSQDQDNPRKPYLPDITVAPPQAASLSKVGEIPIDISTGRMNYTIPIFEIKEGSFSMPINLSYNYSGLVLDESPGYAGVGWTFNIGGSILHSINGLNDEGHETDKLYLYNYIKRLPPYNDQSTPAGQTRITNFLENVANGIFDGEPDKYSVNIGNISCSFYLDKDNKPVFLKNENYKLTGNSTIGFTLTDDQGVNYIFNLAQTADKITENDQYSYNSSFLITEINFPFTTNKITFEYSNVVQYNDINFSQSLIKKTNEYGNPNNNFTLRNNTTTTILNTVKLNKIITNNYTVELQYTNNPIEQGISVISNLTVKDKFSKSVKNYDFTYSGWTGRRTNLLNVKFNGVVTNEMEYDMSLPYPVVLENRDHVRKDLWGYYNRKGELIYASGITDSYNNPKFRPDFESTKIGALTKITYQTKGYSLIEYEPNVVYMRSEDYNFPYDSDGLTTSILGGVATDPFVGNTNRLTLNITNVPVELIPRYQFTNGFEMAGEHDRNGFINLYENGKIKLAAKQYWGREGGDWRPPQRTIMNSDPKNILKIKVPGTYLLEAIADQGITAELSLMAKQTPEYFNQVVGGIRVRQIKNCDFNGECITTVYNYAQDGKSTGLMLQRPEFYSGYSIQDNVACSQGNYVRQDYYNFTSIYPLSNYRGSPVLYKKVEKTDFGKNENDQMVSNGKTIYSYYGSKVSNSLKDEEAYFKTGQLDTKWINNAGNITVSKQKKSYLNETQPDESKFVYALQSRIIMERRGQFSGSGGSSGGGCGLSYPRPLNNFKLDEFRHEAKNYILQKEENINYYEGDSLVQSTSYDYNFNTGFLKSQTTKNSKKEDLEIKYFYPLDSEMASEPYRNELIAKNIIRTPLVTQNYNREKLSEQKTEYIQDASTSNLLLPKYVYTNKGITPINRSIDKKITYDKYDDKGNILQYTLESGTPVSIIWGYNKTHPIAKVENVTYDQISSYVVNLQNLSDADKDNCMSADCTEQILRKALNSFRNIFSTVMITTYTYNPLVGVTSVTDPKGVSSYYEYDSFGRLKFVKDKDLNVLQKYCYNYKGQQTDCNDNGSTSVIVYKSTARSGSFTKNNCASGGTGSSVTYNQDIGASTSTISQGEADALGNNKFNTDGQAYANANGTCTFYSAALSGSFTKSNCSVGGFGSTVPFSQVAGVSSSNISQADADALAMVIFNTNGKANANANGICTFYSIAVNATFTKNNCDAGGFGSNVKFGMISGISSSNNSQADADAKALVIFNANGQANANANGFCTFYSAAISGSFTKNNCSSGGSGSSVPFSQAAGVTSSNASQADADANALAIFNANGQANANTNGFCTFYSAAISGNFTKNNCAPGGAGSSIPFSQAAGVTTSNNSQAEADALGVAKFNQDGQAYANASAICTFWNSAKSGWFTRNNCETGGTPGSITYTVPAGRYTDISQAGADGQAQADVNNNGQAYANANVTCTFWNSVKSGWFTRNNCETGGTPGSIVYTVPAGRYSDVSQAGADGQAQADVSNNGQAYANANVTCTFWNSTKSGWFTRNNCETGGTPGSIAYTVPAGRYSDISQAGADGQAQADVNNNGQAYANANVTCTFWNSAKSGWFTRNNCETGGTPGSITYTVPAGRYSDISQAGADGQAQNDVNNNGQAYANANTICTFWSIAKSGVFTRNNCDAGGYPGSVTYIVPAGRYTDVSQSGADAQAQADVNNNGQYYANTTALCTFYSVARSGSFSKNDCTGGAIGSSVTFSQAAGAAYSNISQADANSLGSDKFYAEGNAYARANGTCSFYNAAVSRTANKSDCGAGRFGTAVTYTVPAKKYSSDISQANADQLAQNDISSNSTAYINANGTCTSETYNAFVVDAEESQKKFWFTVTSSSSDHPQRNINANFYYSYAIGRKIYWGYWGELLVLPAGVTSKTFIISLSFIGWPELESFSIN